MAWGRREDRCRGGNGLWNRKGWGMNGSLAGFYVFSPMTDACRHSSSAARKKTKATGPVTSSTSLSTTDSHSKDYNSTVHAPHASQVFRILLATSSSRLGDYCSMYRIHLLSYYCTAQSLHFAKRERKES